MPQEEQLIITTPPLKEEAKEYLKAKGCTIISNTDPDTGNDQVIFPKGCSRTDELWPRISMVLDHIIFPDGSFIVEQRAIAMSVLSLPIETPPERNQKWDRPK